MPVDALSTTFAALADPTRRAILDRLAQGEASPGELREPFDLSAPAITKHLRVLQKAGLVEQGRDRQWRPCRLRAAPLAEAAQWMDAYRAHWEQRLDRLDHHLRQLPKEPKP